MDISDCLIVRGIWRPPAVPGRHQWSVTLAGMQLTFEARSHQQAKEAAIAYWARCNGDPAHYERCLRERIKEKFRGGIRARLTFRAAESS